MTPVSTVRDQNIAFRVRRRFAAPLDRIFHAWTDPGELERWWCPPGWTPAGLEIDLRVDGRFRFGMKRDGSSEVMYTYGRFIEVRAPELLVYTWNWENAFPGMPETRVTVEFTLQDGGTELTLIHETLPGVALCLRHRSGWLEAFERLRAIVAA